MLHLKQGKFVFDGKMNRQDPASNLKDLWFKENACMQAYAHWLATMTDASFAKRANWCVEAHKLNAQKLHDRIVQLGDDINWFDNWRQINGLVDVVATSLGETIAIADVKNMEEVLLEEYMSKLTNFDDFNLNLLQQELMPVQYKCVQAWNQ